MKELKQPRAKVTREKVVGEAGRLFALKGYHDTKLEEILQRDEAPARSSRYVPQAGNVPGSLFVTRGDPR